MKALILAAGYAVRLYPLTRRYPKPLLPINRKPIINYILDKLNVIDTIDEIIIVTNSKFILQFKKWSEKVKSKKPLSLIDDLTSSNLDRRGAIGDLYFVIEQKRLRDDLLVVGGDNLFDRDLKGFLDFSRSRNPNPVIGVYDIKTPKRTNRYGVVKLNNNNRIIDFKEKPKVFFSTLVAMCLYYFPKDKLRLVREYMSIKGNRRDATGFYINWLRKRASVYGFVFDCRWFDIGDRGFYRKAQESFSK
jgi:glucose-1-phosphate thymidylyltransferase